MKTTITILITFIIAFATSLLLDINFISASNIRIALVGLLIFIELIVGAMVLFNLKFENK
jgi:hypothetical protein